jgi:hypothetical protein
MAAELESGLDDLLLDVDQVDHFYQDYDKLPIINPNKFFYVVNTILNYEY